MSSLILVLIFIFFLGLSLRINFPAVQQNFLMADEAVYYSMTQSLANDFDLQYTKRDLIRYYEDIDSGPLGIFLKKGKEGNIYFAKSFAYPLFVAPLYKIIGKNSFFVFHSFLLLLLLLMGYSYISLWNRSSLSMLVILTFLFGSTAIVYFIWTSPDFFNLTLAFSILYLWLYKLKAAEAESLEQVSRWKKFLLSDKSDILACALAGLAVYAKPTNIVLLAPILLFSISQKKWIKAISLLGIFFIVSGIFWGANALATGEWNYQGGERKIFHNSYPFEKEGLTFDNLGQTMTSEGYVEKHLLPPRIVLWNLFYYFAGRYSGVIWYFFPAFLALFVFLFEKKKLYQWLLLGALAAEILIFITVMPDNFAGGGGALSNRYFIPIYPFFFFLNGTKKKYSDISLSWIFVVVFIGQILMSPLYHSRFPDTHVKRFPFTLFPPELTLINNLPTNTNPAAKAVKVGTQEFPGYIYHLDDHFFPKPKEYQLQPGQTLENGIWTLGAKKAEMILRVDSPIEEIKFHITNNPRMSNTIYVYLGGKKKDITLKRNERGTISFKPGKGFKMRDMFLFRISIRSKKGSIPYYEFEESKDRRHLGIYFELEMK
ncbi:hypothetical protein ACFLT9_03205 [Acidobacteriota bacterium]